MTIRHARSRLRPRLLQLGPPRRQNRIKPCVGEFDIEPLFSSHTGHRRLKSIGPSDIELSAKLGPRQPQACFDIASVGLENLYKPPNGTLYMKRT